MFLELLRKEFIERKNDEKQSIAMLVLSSLLRVLLIAGFIASAKGISIEEVAAKTSENAKRLFGI